MPGTNACTGLPTLPAGLGLAAARDRELVLRVPDALLELPAIGLRLAALHPLELGLGILQLALRPTGIDLACIDRVVHERERAILLDLEEARARGELAHVGFAQIDSRRASLQHGHERSVARKDADLPRRARDDDHLDLALESRALRCHERDVERLATVGHAGYAAVPAGSGSAASASASASGVCSASVASRPRASASSIPPHM